MITTPLRELTKSNVEFKWDETADKAFNNLKELLKKVIRLGFYSKTDRTLLYADASPDALGAVLVQLDKEGRSRIITCASRAFTHVVSGSKVGDLFKHGSVDVTYDKSI